MSTSSSATNSSCRANKYKVCRCDRGGIYKKAEQDNFVTCSSSKRCYKERKLKDVKALFHESCGEKVNIGGKDMYFCLSCTRQYLRDLRKTHPEHKLCSSKYFATCNQDDLNETQSDDFIICCSPISCSTRNGKKAAFHRCCGIDVNGVLWCQACALQPFVANSPYRILSSDVSPRNQQITWDTHPFVKRLSTVKASPVHSEADSTDVPSEHGSSGSFI
jgi:hypothetical protein